eukprot:5812439-Amphidinium_carterae.1
MAGCAFLTKITTMGYQQHVAYLVTKTSALCKSCTEWDALASMTYCQGYCDSSQNLRWWILFGRELCCDFLGTISGLTLYATST